MMAARRESELESVRARIVAELGDMGYSGAERRVKILAGVDVGQLHTLKPAVHATLAAFGRIDYLINNAGVSGAEEMAVDMSLKAWNATLDANLISNYVLMHEVLPLMKKQGSGYVLNVSSYFGGEKNLAVAYPNRSDYAVSKSGQRAMAETMARFLGPEVQINAIAPGPVEGERLKGVAGGRPGLFERRGRLILENKRLNAVHGAIVKGLRRGLRVTVIRSLLGYIAEKSNADAARIADPAFSAYLNATIFDALERTSAGLASELSMFGHHAKSDPSDLTCPIAVWHGEENSSVPVSNTITDFERHPHARLHVLPGVGLYLKQAVYEDIFGWLAGTKKKPVANPGHQPASPHRDPAV
jgi:NAD(P)-dependent dehydrogenase (short-subunit alcohol dehydrogenase family)